MIMSNTVQKSAAEKVEYRDKLKDVEDKIDKLTDFIRDYKNIVVYTGSQLDSNIANPKLKPGHPTKGHMALKVLIDRDLVKGVVSFNTDGLHRKSGIPKSKLIEINGNTHQEVCEVCNMKYMRDFRTVESTTQFDHRTSRKCDNVKCGGQLHDNALHSAE